MTAKHNPAEAYKLRYLPLDTIRPNPAQPRRQFDPEELRSLSESIRANGVLQPLTVRAAAQTLFIEPRHKGTHGALIHVPAAAHVKLVFTHAAGVDPKGVRSDCGRAATAGGKAGRAFPGALLYPSGG